ncbi:GM21784 [Drosophila sechellia]|uniref:GM21784 n=1 Tax=Drosophila sechellia TaxID=7238 RepID=B4HMU8_DROSE|nr:GM21784 [Drosophila sechellia]
MEPHCVPWVHGSASGGGSGSGSGVGSQGILMGVLERGYGQRGGGGRTGERGREERAASPTGKTVAKTAKDQQKEPKTKASLWEKERN